MTEQLSAAFPLPEKLTKAGKPAKHTKAQLAAIAKDTLPRASASIRRQALIAGVSVGPVAEIASLSEGYVAFAADVQA